MFFFEAESTFYFKLEQMQIMNGKGPDHRFTLQLFRRDLYMYEPAFSVISWRAKPEVTSGRFMILPELQLLLTRTNQNKLELCS
jgi:hypothetical protein